MRWLCPHADTSGTVCITKQRNTEHAHSTRHGISREVGKQNTASTNRLAASSLLSQVVLRHRNDCHIFFAANIHTVDGKGNHKVPGNGAARARWKGAAATNILQDIRRYKSTYQLPPDTASVSMLIAGDFNLKAAQLVAQLQTHEDLADTPVLCTRADGNLHVITDTAVTVSKDVPEIQGPDNQHTALWAVVNHRVAPKAVPPVKFASLPMLVQEQVHKAPSM